MKEGDLVPHVILARSAGGREEGEGEWGTCPMCGEYKPLSCKSVVYSKEGTTIIYYCSSLSCSTAVGRFLYKKMWGKEPAE